MKPEAIAESCAPKNHPFEKLATTATTAAGSTTAIIAAFVIVLLWGISGPIFHYSEDWQLIINTGTTIITFLMVFLIQKSQNKESLSIQLKLNELVAAHEFACNRLVNVECMTEDELKVLQKCYSKLNELAKQEKSLQLSHSIDEAENRNEIKEELEHAIKAVVK